MFETPFQHTHAISMRCSKYFSINFRKPTRWSELNSWFQIVFDPIQILWRLFLWSPQILNTFDHGVYVWPMRIVKVQCISTPKLLGYLFSYQTNRRLRGWLIIVLPKWLLVFSIEEVQNVPIVRVQIADNVCLSQSTNPGTLCLAVFKPVYWI